jgi:hypothetical protein
MMFISIDSRLVRGHQMIGGKGAKGGNLESAGKTGPADDVAKRQKLAETAGNSFLGPYNGAKVFSGAGLGPLRRAFGDWRIACGNCGNSHDESHQGFVSALGNLGNLGNLQAGNPPAPIAVRKNSRSPRSARAISCRTATGSTGFRRAKPQATVLDQGRGRTYFAAPQKRP